MDRNQARVNPIHRGGGEGGSRQRQRIRTTGETLFGPAEATLSCREADKGESRKPLPRSPAGAGVVEVELTIAGRGSNRVTLAIE